MEHPSAAADGILAATRWTFLCFALILVSAVAILWFQPAHTADRWAWTISPEITPVFMGSVYAAGAFVFVRLFASRVWHPYAPVLIGAIVLTTLLLLATLIHFDRFNHGDGPLPADVAFYGWVGIYALAPPWITWLWWRNRGADPGDSGVGVRVPARVRASAAVIGALAAVAAAVMWLWPAGVADVWPWLLTPLTARVLASYVATIAVLGLVLSRDGRWSSWRPTVQTLLVFDVILLIGSLRRTGDFEGGVATGAYFASLAAALVFLVALISVLEGRRFRP